MIVNAPGCDNVKVVASYTSSQPHFVRLFQSGKVTCDCQNNESLALCSHTIAVANNENCLSRLLEQYNKTKQSVNLWKLLKSFKVPKNPGAKPHQVSSHKRKGKDKLLLQSHHSFDTSADQPGLSTRFPHNFSANPGQNPYPWSSTQIPYPWSSTSFSMAGPVQNTDYYDSYNLPPASPFNPPASPFNSPFNPPAPPFNPYQQRCSYVPYHSSGQSSSDSSHIEIQHNTNPFIAVIRHGNISKCTSCGETFLRDRQVLVVKHVEKSLYKKDGEIHVSGERPHYYHAEKSCILRKHSYFKHDLLSIDTDINLIEAQWRVCSSRTNDIVIVLMSSVQLYIVVTLFELQISGQIPRKWRLN